MSDAGSPPPPPPPRDLPPPPGYVGYEGGLIGAVPLGRVGGLRTAILVLLAVYAAGQLIALATNPAAVDAAQDLADGVIDDDQFLSRFAGSLLSQLAVSGATIAIFVITLIWLHRIVGNHRLLGRRTTWGQGMAVGGWFLPPGIVYAIPMLVLRESWKAADPTSPPGDERWRSSSVNPIIYVWWVLFGLVPIFFVIAGVGSFQRSFSSDADDIAENLRDTQGLTIASGIVALASAVAWGLLVRALTARHQALTGEAPRSG